MTRLGDLLVAAGAAQRDDVERAAAQATRTGKRLGEALIELGAAEERDIYRQLAAQRGLPFAEFDAVIAGADPHLQEGAPPRFLSHNRVLPLRLAEDCLSAATCEPDGDFTQLAFALGAHRLELLLITPTDFERLRIALDLGQRGARAAKAGAGAGAGPGASGAGSVRDLLHHDLDAELIGLLQGILLDAIGERASDVHFELYGRRVRVRLRIDGDLHDVPRYVLTPAQLAGLINVIKVSSRLDIAERRAPQAGRFTISAHGHNFDLRVQTQPTLHGEHAVIRLLPQDSKLLDIEDLGLSPQVAQHYRRLLDVPAGLVLVVGPTGSGKSTTLYAGLGVLARDGTRKVLTVEDPIEYAIEGVQQSQIAPEVGFTFANAVRVFVRQDPDVILVGEVRDGETALEALRASQTGHLVLTTLHCNDAIDAVQRLLDLGMHPNSVASELLAVFAQRLAKRICPGCREPATPSAAILAELFPGGAPPGLRCFRGRGCARCNRRGSHGRIAVVEYLPAGPAVRRAISLRQPVDELREVALQAGLLPMRDQALALVQAGLIALDELPALLPPERLAPERHGGSELLLGALG